MPARRVHLDDIAHPNRHRPISAHRCWFGEQREASLRALVDENQRLASRPPSSGVDLDYDPVCQCQHVDGIVLEVMTVRPSVRNLVEVRVKRGGIDTTPPEGWVLVLSRAGRSWLIHDVIEDGKSLRARMAAHNACMRHSKTSDDIDTCIARADGR